MPKRRASWTCCWSRPTRPNWKNCSACWLPESARPQAAARRWTPPAPPAEAPLEPAVDVIIPVYKGIRETLSCVESVLAAACRTPREVICILDHPDAPEMRCALERLAAEGSITLLVNEKNVGFVRTVNRGMALHPSRDVTLLNSDTVVHHDWLDRLREAAWSSPEIGTVTPFSNRATICSYPKFVEDNELPEGCTSGELDAVCGAVNAGEVVDLPTAIGFCMYIRRDCLRETGIFNAEAFGKGYGEENDFCRRAAESGWRNVLAANVFVEHLGSVSFQDSKDKLIKRNLQVLGSLYPYYHAMVQVFLREDPIRKKRRKIDIRRLESLGKRVFCLVSHSFGGGTLTHMQHLSAQLRADGVTPVSLRCAAGGRVRMEVSEPAGLENLVYQMPAERDELAKDLRAIGTAHFHFHSNINVPLELWELPALCGLPYDCTVHDYSWFCPRVHLVGAEETYCGEPPAEGCAQCIAGAGAHTGWELKGPPEQMLARLRENSAAQLAHARRIYCPSEDARRRIAAHFEAPAAVAQPHSEPCPPPDWQAAPPAPGEALRVAVIGAIGIEKGSQVLLRCARDAHQRRLPLTFVVFGYTNDDSAFRALPNVTVTGAYTDATLPELLRQHRPHMAFFPGVWPETFSYTLSIALQCGLYPVAFDLGAIAERGRASGFAEILPLEMAADAEATNQRLLECGKRLSTIPRPPFQQTQYPSAISDYYGL